MQFSSALPLKRRFIVAMYETFEFQILFLVDQELKECSMKHNYLSPLNCKLTHDRTYKNHSLTNQLLIINWWQ